MDEPQSTAPDRDELEISLLDLALVLAENIWVLVLAPLAAGLVALGFAFQIPPTFTATTRILPPQQQQSAAAGLVNQLGLSGLAGAAAGIRNSADTYVALINSWTVADRLVERFKLKDLYEVKFGEDARKALAGSTRVTTNRKDGVIVIEVDDHDPKRAADLANAYVDELRNLDQNFAVTEAAQRRLFFENQVKRAKDDLTQSEVALRGSGVSEATLKTVPGSALAMVAELRAKITMQEVTLASMRGFMADANPKFKRVQQELAALRAQLAKAGESASSKAGGGGAEYIAKYRYFKYHEMLFELMVKQYEAARLDEAREGAVIQVIDAALPPERKSRPKKALIAVLTTMVAFFVVVLALFVRRALRNAAADPETARKLAYLRGCLRLRRT